MADLSLVIPCYNEEKNIKKLFNDIYKIKNKLSIEIIIINNGSTDNSKKVINLNKKKIKGIKIINVEKNVGFGHGVKMGISKAKSKAVCYMHGDLQIDIKNVLKTYRIYESEKSKKIFVKSKRSNRPLIDIFFTFLMSVFNSVLFRKYLYDIHAQPNLFHKSMIKNIKQLPNDMSLDLYIFLCAKFYNYKIVRFKVNFLKRKHGVGSNDNLIKKVKYSLHSLFSSLKIFFNASF